MRKSVIISLLLAPLLCFGSETSQTLSENEKDAASKIICKFYSESSEELLAQAETLMPQLMSLMNIPPFKLLSFVLSDLEMATQFSNGLRDPTKGNLFVQGFGFRMMQEVTKESFKDELSTFCTSFGLKQEVMNMFIEKADWGRFLLYSLKGSRKA